MAATRDGEVVGTGRLFFILFFVSSSLLGYFFALFTTLVGVCLRSFYGVLAVDGSYAGVGAWTGPGHFNFRGGRSSAVPLIASRGVLLSTGGSKCTMNTFGMRGVRVIGTIVTTTRRLGTPIVLRAAPSAMGCKALRAFTKVIGTRTRGAGVPMYLRLSRNGDFRLTIRTVGTNCASIVVSNSRRSFRGGVTIAGGIMSMTGTFNVPMRTRLNGINKGRSSLRTSTSAGASPRRTGRFMRHAKISSLTMTVKATRNFCMKAPILSGPEMDTVGRIMSIPLILRKTSKLDRRSMERYMRHKVYGIGFTARLHITCASTIGGLLRRGPRAFSPGGLNIITVRTMGRRIVTHVGVYKYSKGTMWGRW